MKAHVLTSKRAQLLFIVLAVIEVLLISLMLATVSDGQRASEQESRYSSQIEIVDNITSIVTSSTITLLTQDNAGLEQAIPEIKSSLRKSTQQLNNLDSQEAEKQKGKTSLAQVIDDVSEIAETIDAMIKHGDNVDNAILMGNLDGVLHRITPSTQKLRAELSRKKAEFAGKKDAQFGSLPWLLIASMVIPVIAAFYANYFAFKLSMRMKTIRGSVVAISRGDQVVETLSGSDELSELHDTIRELSVAMDRARRKERAMIDNAGEIICSLDGSLRLSELNPAVRKLGFTPDELLGTNIQSLIHPKDKEESHKHLESVKKSGSEAAFEARLRTKEGQYMFTSWSATWSPDDESIFCVIHDITDRKRAEQLKQDVLAMVSHDLRAPLTSIGVVLDMVVEGAAGELNERGERLVSRAQIAVGSLISMIKDLLDVERAEAGGLALTMESTNARELVQRSLDVVRPEAERKKMTLKVNCEEVSFQCDSERVSRILVNLVNNALKFSPDGKTIFVVGKLLTHRNVPTEMEFQVIDEGTGIPTDKLESIFEKFTQVGTGSAGERMGSGLGLAICKTLVEAHNGKIGVTSTVGEGTTFWFRLPYIVTTALLIFFCAGTFDSPQSAAFAAPGRAQAAASKQPEGRKQSSPGTIGTSLRVLEPSHLVPFADRPVAASSERLYNYLLRFGTIIDLYTMQNHKEAIRMCNLLMHDIEKSGDLLVGFYQAEQDSHRLMMMENVTPLLKTSTKCGNVYKRIYMETLEMRGNCLKLYDPNAALVDLNKVLFMCPDYLHARVKMAEAYIQLGQLSKAMEQVNIAIEGDSRLHEAYFFRALISKQMHKNDEQQADLQRANMLASAETNELRKFENAHNNADTNAKPDPAFTARFILNNPRSAFSIGMHAECLADMGYMKEARRLASIAIAVDREDPIGYATKAYVEQATGQFETAVRDATAALKLFPDNPTPDLHLTRGLAYINLGQYQNAIKDLNYLIEFDPESPEGYVYRAGAYVRLGEYKKAFMDSAKAVRLDPDFSLAHNNLGAALARLGRFDESCQAFESAVLLDRKYRGSVTSQLRYNLGRQYERIGNKDRAIKNYDLTLLSDPLFAVKMFSQAAAAAQHGTRDADIKAALSSGSMPKIPFVNKEEIEDSRVLLNRTVALAPRKKEARYNSALAAICLDKKKEAVDELQLLLRSKSPWTDRAVVLLFLCRQRSGQEELGKKELRAAIPKIKDPVIKALARFFTGEGSEAEIFAVSHDTASSTIANSYLGHYYRSLNNLKVASNTAKAKNYIGAALQRGERMSIEFVIVLTELERMCGVKYDAKIGLK